MIVIYENRGERRRFIEKGPSWGRYSFSVGSKTVTPREGDFVFVDDQGETNTALGTLGLKVGRLMGGAEYLIVANREGRNDGSD